MKGMKLLNRYNAEIYTRRFALYPALAVASVVALSATPASAQPVTITATNGTLFTTTAMSAFTTLGSDMAGMLVTATFIDTTSQTLTWTDVVAGTGGVTSSNFAGAGTFWRVWCQGDSSGSGNWFIYNNTGLGMTSLVFNGVPGRTTFDRTLPTPGTPGSATGADFAITLVNPGGAVPVSAQYTNILRLGTNAPVGDEYTMLRLTFTGAGGIPGANKTVRFTQDTDNAASAIVTVQTGAPEPGSLALAGLLLPILGGVVANRRRKA